MQRSLLFLLLLLAPLRSWGAVYYIANSGNDSHPCTQAQPCQSIATGVRKLAPGDTLYLRGGSYSTTIDTAIGIPSGSGESGRTTIAGYPGETVTLTGGIFLYQATLSYVTFGNFVTDGGNGIQLYGSNIHHIRIQDVEVKNRSSSGIQWGSFYAGGPAHHIELLRANVHHNGTNWLEHGIYACGPDSLIEDSLFHDNSGSGIQWYDASWPNCGDRVVMRGNRIYHNGTAGPGAGGVTLNHGNDMLFTNNLVSDHQVPGSGTAVAVCYASTGTNNNAQILNNTITNNAGAGIDICVAVTNARLCGNHIDGEGVSDHGTGTRMATGGGDCPAGSSSPTPAPAPGPTPLPAPRNLKVVGVP